MPEAHTPIDGTHRVPLDGAQAIGPSNPNMTIEVTVKLRRKAAPPVLPDPAAAPLTRDELAEQYGASSSDIETVTTVLEKYGLTVVRTDATTRTMVVSGRVEDMEAAFDVKLFQYEHPDGNYRGRIGDISVPASLADIVEGVFGLDQRRVAHRRRPHSTKHLTTARDPLAAIPSSWYTPAQLAQHYNFPAGTGNGQVLGLFEFGGGFFPADLQTFCQLTKTPVPTVKTISVDGTPTNAKDGAEGEVMLDVEVMAGACPAATIVVYFAHWSEQGWLSILDALINDKANDPGVVSISWGAPEDTDIWTDAGIAQVDASLKDAALLGITVCVAAGDDGSGDGTTDGHAHADFPASSEYVLAVGGTTIPSKTAKQDIVWFEHNGVRPNGGSTGGGVSAVIKRPSYQSAITIKSVNPGAIAGRCIPDLAANADWNASPYLLVVDGASQGNGGTSAASPLMASLVARMNAALGKRLGYLTPRLYQSVAGANGQTVGSAGCNDITKGSNKTAHAGGYNAGPGYDAVSGWGTPNGAKLLAALQGPVATSVKMGSPSSQSVGAKHSSAPKNRDRA